MRKLIWSLIFEIPKGKFQITKDKFPIPESKIQYQNPSNMTPFTLDEAKEIWDDFEDLKDTEFKLDGPAVYLVLDVVVAPFPDADKQAFMGRYSETKDAQESLGYYYGSDYDVLLVACDVDDEATCIYIDIRTFAADKGVHYSFPQSA
jgi:hypothetical protein